MYSKWDMQREQEERRARYLQEYHNEISRVDKITSEARVRDKGHTPYTPTMHPKLSCQCLVIIRVG